MSQIIFFNKNYADYEKTYVSVTASQGQSSASAILDRSNRSAWGTSGSVDADNTTLVINFGDTVTINSILLVKHNFKEYLIEYYDDAHSIYVSTGVHPTTSTDTTSYHTISSTTTTKMRITIYKTQVANSDKTLCQFIATTKIGQFSAWPIISEPIIGRNLVTQQTISGKSSILPNVGFYSTSLMVSNLSNSTDLSLIESLFNASDGFLFWPCGGDQTQFKSVRQGYRLEDIYLVRCQNEWSPEFVDGLYKTGFKVQMDLKEVIT